MQHYKLSFFKIAKYELNIFSKFLLKIFLKDLVQIYFFVHITRDSKKSR